MKQRKKIVSSCPLSIIQISILVLSIFASFPQISFALESQTITFDPISNKTYGDANFTVSANSTSNLTVSFTAYGNCTIEVDVVHITGAGICTVNASQEGNDTYDPAPNVSQSFGIDRKTLTVVGIISENKTYDRNDVATIDFDNAILVGNITDDDVTIDNSSATGAFENATAGTEKTVFVSGLALTGDNASNYNLSAYNTTAAINQKTVTISGLTALNKVFDNTTAATLNASVAILSGNLTDDNVTLDSSSAVGTFENATVGTDKTVTVSGLALIGDNASNYNLSAYNTTANITKATATITLGNLSQIYNGTARVVSNTTSPSELTVIITYDGSASAPTNVGAYRVNATINDANYQGNTTGILAITQVSSDSITSTASNASVDLSNTTQNNITFNMTNTDVTLGLNTSSVVTGGAITINELNTAPNTSSVGIPSLGKYVEIMDSSDISGNMTSAIITMYYTDAEVSSAGLVESSLRLYYFNTSSGNWTTYANGGVDTTNNYVWAVTDHFSLWGIFGSAAPVTSSPPSSSSYSSYSVGCTANYSIISLISIRAKAGSTITLPVTVSNLGNCAYARTVYATVPDGWTASSANTSFLSEDDSETVNISVTIPAEASTSDIIFKVSANGKVFNSSTSVVIEPEAPAMNTSAATTTTLPEVVTTTIINNINENIQELENTVVVKVVAIIIAMIIIAAVYIFLNRKRD